MARHVIPTMGTVFSLDLRDPAPREVLAQVEADLMWVDATFSTYRADSDISRLAAGRVRLRDCAPEVADVLGLCAEFTRRTDGYFTATPSGTLDPTGLVKGWAIKRACGILAGAGLTRFAVNGGGDVQTVGAPDTGPCWRIGISDPHLPSRVKAVVCGVDIAVATSGTAERGQHIINPYTGRAATALSSVTVVGPDIVTADVYATAAFAMEAAAPEWLSSLADYQAFIVDGSGAPWATPGFSKFTDPRA